MESSIYDFNISDIIYLIEVVSKDTTGDSELVHKRYERYGRSYFEVLNFLIAIGLVINKKNVIEISSQLKKHDDSKIIVQIIKNRILQSKKLTDVYELLMKFKSTNVRFEYKPTDNDRFSESNVRNLLIKMDIIKYDQNEDTYFIETSDYTEFINKFEDHKKLSLKDFKIIESNRELIGAKAETVVLKYEQERLSSNRLLANRITYTALEDINAGYDISSFESPEDNQPRLIEIKAVSPIDFRFNWSTNEVDAAKRLGKHYYLYLVPIINNLPDISAAMFIENPASAVLNQNIWHVEKSGYIVEKSLNHLL